MKKNLYKYAAMAVIGETLNDKTVLLRSGVEYTKERYKDDENGIPAWAQDEIDKNTGMADYIEDFISKL